MDKKEEKIEKVCIMGNYNGSRDESLFEKLWKSQKDIPPEFDKVVSDNFWELI